MRLLAVILFHCILQCISSLSVQLQPCVTNCHCTSSNVNCTNYATKLNKLPADRLDYNLDGNGLTVVGGGNFSHMTKMRWITLANNNIRKVGSHTFTKNTKLTVVILSHNSITRLPDALFNYTPNLKRFYCDHNKLTYISRFLFKGLKNLTDIRLHDNKISAIHQTAFLSPLHISHLYLENNLLEIAYWQWIVNLNQSASTELEMDNNPWSCDCRMAPFWHNITKNKFISRYAYGPGKCRPVRSCNLNLPECLIGDTKRPLIMLKKPDLRCNRSVLQTQKIFTGNEGNSTKIFCNSTGHPPSYISIVDASGKTLAHGRGNVSFTFRIVYKEEAGDYLCSMKGFDNHGNPIYVNKTLTLRVNVKPGISAGAILAIILVIIVIMGAVYGLWRKMQRRNGYGELASGSGPYYELDDSQVVSPPPQITTLEEDNIFPDEEVYSKSNDDKEVLV